MYHTIDGFNGYVDNFSLFICAFCLLSFAQDTSDDELTPEFMALRGRGLNIGTASVRDQAMMCFKSDRLYNLDECSETDLPALDHEF